MISNFQLTDVKKHESNCELQQQHQPPSPARMTSPREIKRESQKSMPQSNLSTNQCRLLLHDCPSSPPRGTSRGYNASDKDHTNITTPQENGQHQLTSRFGLVDVVSSATDPEALAAPAVEVALHPADLHAQIGSDNGRRRGRAAGIG